MSNVGYPRIERNVDGEPIINIGPYGGLAPSAAFVYPHLPKRWPKDWPEDGVIFWGDPRVVRYLFKAKQPRELDSLLYYEERALE